MQIQDKVRQKNGAVQAGLVLNREGRPLRGIRVKFGVAGGMPITLRTEIFTTASSLATRENSNSSNLLWKAEFRGLMLGARTLANWDGCRVLNANRSRLKAATVPSKESRYSCG